jgi:hypothetical protein
MRAGQSTVISIRAALSAGVLFAILASGCGRLTSSGVQPASVDPQSAAAAAIEYYDKSADGHLSDAELEACPAINNSLAKYDTDADRKISQAEIANRLQQLYSSGAGLFEVQCSVTRGGRPLSGANVRFIPEPFLGDSVHEATATTDIAGRASPGIAADKLPENIRTAQLMHVGLYRVEIEHPSIPQGAGKALGFEVDPNSREGAMARFNI